MDTAAFNLTYETFPSMQKVWEDLPASLKMQRFVCESRQQVKNILDGIDQRLLIVLGPCSIHDLTAAEEYALQVKSLSEKVTNHCLLVMRAYFMKPRTGIGWRGWISDPFLDQTHNIETGLYTARAFLLKLANLNIPAAIEFVDPLISPYIADLITWGAIGARTVKCPLHRQLASSLPLPIGFKNTLDGDCLPAIHALMVAQQRHDFLTMAPSGSLAKARSKGNLDTHLILRGGNKGPNYDKESIEHAKQLLIDKGLPVRLMIDCAHGNSKHKPYDQQIAWQYTLDHIAQKNSGIIGLMLESNLFAGNQPLSSHLRYGVSITDPCLDWETTEKMVLNIQAAHIEDKGRYPQNLSIH
ncbi:MAG: phospho-2-dehydro-3-deoxyheptonate aldolase [Chlamydiales bacterium]|jgi:3-deoxy-7-phosphoheptulonate synthase|nr:phospho-2-dehydro-3-deoxyheptonate aldolase [Chlamydiales bacterium]